MDAFEKQIAALKKARKEASALLQKTLFEKFQFLNQQKETKALIDIFNNPAIKPPAGAGECAAPKLLQFAFKNDLTPVCMGEFWWGISPNSAIRKHKNFYPACQGRCKPILNHMLDGIAMDENLLIQEISKDKTLATIYEDDVMLVIHKPAEFLSVPGKEITDAVYTRIKEKYPNATGTFNCAQTRHVYFWYFTTYQDKRSEQTFTKSVYKKNHSKKICGAVGWRFN